MQVILVEVVAGEAEALEVMVAMEEDPVTVIVTAQVILDVILGTLVHQVVVLEGVMPVVQAVTEQFIVFFQLPEDQGARVVRAVQVIQVTPEALGEAVVQVVQVLLPHIHVNP
jgi:hypothetical protein